ncbi:TPA: zinc-ribbon domain-containing protein [Streptococcus suis]|nr:zinc-ribbon domain-containing protein [Streptococcus suis]HEM5301450.1 zinc-ribbon domain-containing protein [Streptococcus suis]
MPKVVKKRHSQKIAESILDKYPNLINYLDFQKENFQNLTQAKASLLTIPHTSKKRFHFKCPTCRMSWKSIVNSQRLVKDSDGLLYHVGCNETLRNKKYSEVYPNLRKITKCQNLFYKLTLESNVTIPIKWKCDKCSHCFELSIDKMLSRIKYRGYYCEECKGTFDKLFHNRYVYNQLTPPLAHLNSSILDNWSKRNNISKWQVDILSNIKVNWDCPSCKGIFGCKVSEREHTECPYCSNEKMLRGFNTLRNRHEKLQIFWNPNNTKNMDEVWEKSKEVLEWICPCCHVEFSCKANEMIARVSLDNKNFQTCPNLCNWTEEVFNNNVLYDYPKLIREWGKKNDIKIHQALTNSDLKKYWWDCPKCNGSYQTSIPNRKNNEDCCPYCNWKLPMTGFNTLQDIYPELATYWRHCKTVELRDFIPHEFDNRTVTWFCNRCQTPFEEKFSIVLKTYKKSSKFSISSVCIYCTLQMPHPELNSLDRIKPYLIEEWVTSSNGPMNSYFENSEANVSWMCKKCHSIFFARINNRHKNDNCCPNCHKPGYKNFSLGYPELLKEWDYLNNMLIVDPNILKVSSSKKVWWICQKNKEHRYNMKVSTRVQFYIRAKEPCIICKGLRRKREHFISYEKIQPKQA